MTSLPFPVYDGDQHMYEAADAFTRYLPDRYKSDFYFVQKDGRDKLVLGGMLSEFIPNPTFAVVARPGAAEAWFRGDNPEGATRKEVQGRPIVPPQSWRTAEGRIAELETQGLHASLIFPTLASVIEERIGARGDVASALFRSLNRWIADDWGFARDDRLFAVPFISLTDAGKAVEELEEVLRAGARAVNIRPAPVPDIRGSRSFGFEEYDPFWARVAEAGIFVTLHGSDSGYDRITGWWSGGHGEYRPFIADTFRATVDLIGRAISDSISALICHGVFDRHPKLKVYSVENGSSWVKPLFDRLDRAYGQMPQAFRKHPRDQFIEHIWVSPFYEDDVGDLKNHIPVERIVFGSDFPHVEGVQQPLNYLGDFADYAPDEIEKIFSANIRNLLEGRAS